MMFQMFKTFVKSEEKEKHHHIKFEQVGNQARNYWKILIEKKISRYVLQVFTKAY